VETSGLQNLIYMHLVDFLNHIQENCEGGGSLLAGDLSKNHHAHGQSSGPREVGTSELMKRVRVMAVYSLMGPVYELPESRNKEWRLFMGEVEGEDQGGGVFARGCNWLQYPNRI